MTDLNREIRKLAAEHYDTAAGTGKHYLLTDVEKELVADLTKRYQTGTRSIVSDLIVAAAHAAVLRVDESRTAPEPQATLLDSMAQPVAVADRQRIVRRSMTAADWAAHLGHVADNAARVNASAAKENKRFSALAAYLTGDTTTEAAFAEWQAANPGAELP